MSKSKQDIDGDQPATRKDVEEIVTNVVSEAIGEALKVISSHFVPVMDDLADIKYDMSELQTKVSDLDLGQARIERKLDATINFVDNLSITVKRHDKELRKLRPKIA